LGSKDTHAQKVTSTTLV